MATIRSSFFISGAAIALIIIVPLVTLAAWSEPTQAPTGGNVDPPINTGSQNQNKNGGLSVTSFAVFGSTALNGNTYLKTGVTGSIYRYLNFGANYDVDGDVIASTIGESGYGIRDKDGTLEFKNLGGDWSSIQDTVNALAGTWFTSGNNIYNTNPGNVGVGVSNPGAKLEVAGSVKIGNGAESCQASIAGTVRYNTTEKALEYCDGTSWQIVNGRTGASLSSVSLNCFNDCSNTYALPAGTANVRIDATCNSAAGAGSGTYINWELRNAAGAFVDKGTGCYGVTGGSVSHAVSTHIPVPRAATQLYLRLHAESGQAYSTATFFGYYTPFTS